MKNFVRPWPVVVALLSLMLAPAVARATVVWTANMEKGDLSEWSGTTNGTITLPGGVVRTNIAASAEQAYAGRYSCKVTVHPDDDYGDYHQDRADIKHNSTLTGEGKDSWLSGYYFLPEDAKTRNEFIFWETGPPYTNWVDVWIEPKTGGGTTIKLGIESNGANLGSVLIWTGTLTPAQWHQIAMHIHWSMDSTKGLVDFWLDGQQVVSGYKHKTKPNTADLFFQTGLHRVLMQPYTEMIYFDDFIEADTKDDIKIGAPMTGNGPTDAGTDADGSPGTAGAAGTTGTGGAGGTSGTTGSGGTSAASGSGGSTGAAGSGSAGAAGTGTVGAAGNSPTGVAGAGAPIGAAGKSGGSGRTTSSGGCAIAGSDSLIHITAGLALVGLLVLHSRRRRSFRARIH